MFWHYYPPTHTLHKPVSPTWRGKSHATLNTDAVSLEIDEDEESISSYASSYHSAELDYAGGDDLPELLPREAAQAPAPRGFARPGDLSAGGGVV